MKNYSVAYTKTHISELIAKATYNNERFIITRRNQPVAALVSLQDLQIIQQHEERQGLASIAGQWQGFEEISEILAAPAAARDAEDMGRDVSL